MSARNYHELTKLVAKEGTNRTDEELTFKKPFQTVSRPPTTDHNIHEDYVRHPPHNTPGPGATTSRKPGKKEWARKPEPMEVGILGNMETGRLHQADIEGDILNRSSVHR
ncbi:hypothetical protein K503DRAFT_768114 [Rhizopogon vinicolor AM-OR11-026]|uniref:Uncharacterized protein n=1 Tax=Rhizopogon vinicolor AM-OR11-026 TaxID=1314800 RepID=A0A1B7N7V8_9AGAM|nr:hypothetical protein K503DRAFT_768114 [Rhizopogon vinicolor AM-OR11-026]